MMKERVAMMKERVAMMKERQAMMKERERSESGDYQLLCEQVRSTLNLQPVSVRKQQR